MDEYVKAREDICNSCDKMWIKFTARICGECGCFIKTKTMLKNTKCPLGKWDEVKDDGSKK